MVIRHEKGRYSTAEELINEILAPTNNDFVYVEALNREFHWVAGNQLIADNIYLIEQLSVSLLGRWQATTVEGKYYGTSYVEKLGDSQALVLDLSVEGVLISSGNIVAITNANTLPNGLLITSKEVIADGIVRIVLRNNAGVTINALTINVAVIEVIRGEFSTDFGIDFNT